VQVQMSPLASQIMIRPGYADDYEALVHLAALDSADRVPARPLLLAEVDGELRAALSLSDGTSIADPFFPTADIVALVRAHAEGLARPRRPRLRLGQGRLGLARG
jgi:hypothetical protein